MNLTPINPHFNACDQNWELMPEHDGGRHCGACDKVLIDFTLTTEQEVLNQQRTNDFKLCGRYTVGQVDRINRHLALEESQNNRPWLVSLAMGLSSFIPLGAAAQDTPADTIVLDKVEIDAPKFVRAIEREVSGKMLVSDYLDATAQQKPDSIKIPIAYSPTMPGVPGSVRYPLIDSIAYWTTEVEGTVTYEATGQPAILAPVFIESLGIGTETDLEGKFKMNVPANNHAYKVVLSVVARGYSAFDMELDLSQPTNEPVKIVLGKRPPVKEQEYTEIVCKGSFTGVPSKNRKTKYLNPANWYRMIKARIR